MQPLALGLGCTSTLTPGEKSAGIRTTPIVQTAGAGKQLSPTIALSNAEFEKKLAGQLVAQRFDSAARLVRRFPEYASAVSGSKGGSQPQQEFIRKTLGDSGTIVASDVQQAGFASSLSVKQPMKAYATSEEELTRSDALRKGGKKAESIQIWTHAMEVAASALDSRAPVIDPAFWEKASSLKPAEAAWPESVIAAWKNQASKRIKIDEAPLMPEGFLWTMIGAARLDRGEAQGALTAFKRAESYGHPERDKSWLLLLQVQALLQLNQQQAAMTLLVPLAGTPTTSIGAAASAMLGSIRLSEGGTEPALKLLKAAVETEKAPADWPGRDEAQADLALAYLSNGDEKNGLKWLTAARECFANAAKTDHLIQSYENEARYFESISRPQEATAARRMITEFERGSGRD